MAALSFRVRDCFCACVCVCVQSYYLKRRREGGKEGKKDEETEQIGLTCGLNGGEPDGKENRRRFSIR